MDAWLARDTSPSCPWTREWSTPRGRALRDAEKEMTRLERRKQTLTERLLGVSDRDEQARLGRELEAVLGDLHRAEGAWLAFFE